MKLFDEIERDCDGPSGYSEPRFEYRNRSARPEYYKIREVLEDWFFHYPEKERAEFRGRFRSTIDSHHHSAFFELFLHELLLKLNCQVHVHPNPPSGIARCPDFLVESPNGNKFYMEAVLVTDMSDAERGALLRMNVVYDALNRLDSPDFFIGMKINGAPETPPSASDMRSFLTGKIRLLKPDELAEIAQRDGLEALPRWNYEHDGWVIDFYPIPKGPNTRGKPYIRPIATQEEVEVRCVEPRLSVRDAILKKANRYGNFDLPYVVAVNYGGEDLLDNIDIMEALFGKEQHIIKSGYRANGETSPNIKFTRIPDGVWTSKTGPQYSRVSAVIVANMISPHNINRTNIRLYHNPWATHPYVSELMCLPQAVPQNFEGEFEVEYYVGRGLLLKHCEGASLGTLFGLSSEWPMD